MMHGENLKLKQTHTSLPWQVLLRVTLHPITYPIFESPFSTQLYGD